MWRELTEQDVRDALSDREVESYTRAAAGPSWDPAAVARVLAKTADLVRGYLLASPRRPAMGPGRTLPPALIGPAADYAAVSLIRRVPVEIRKERLDARAEALKLFESVARGEIAVEHHAEDAAAAGSARRISALAPGSGRKRADPAHLEGLP
ncbi:MAG: DUF1320 family protein [Kiritimatiellae bacterium]|nr:DUF1320 family protein [Kiritimatiellia bacterium]